MTHLTIKKTPCLPDHLADMFMAAASKGQTTPDDLITLLSQMAMGSDHALAKEASTSIYSRIILPLCDDFSSHGVDVANRVLITMIQTFCRTKKGKKAQQILEEFALSDQESFLSRHQALTRPRTLSLAARRLVKKVFILSRVSLGADIAITSLIISQAQKALPDAEIFLVGPNHLRHLFYNNGLHYLDFPYNREGGFLEKMEAWPRLFHLLAKESKDLAPHGILLFDPDTRLSQLGLLPLTYTSSTFYLCTRLDQTEKLTLSALTNGWLDQILPDIPPVAPHFRINPEHFTTWPFFFKTLAPTTFKIVINFGVSNDDNKRLADPFEEELLATLLQTKNTLIILDSGKGEKEEKMAKRLMAKIGESGYNTAELSERKLAETEISFQHGLLRFTGRIDAMAGLISSSDLFIGYDSCGQHVATATETPAIICFSGAANKRFLERWQPGNHHGKTTTFIIDQKPVSPEQRAELIEKIVQTADRYRC